MGGGEGLKIDLSKAKKIKPIHFEEPTLEQYADQVVRTYVIYDMLRACKLLDLLAYTYLIDMLDTGDED
jgi:hypothetical protein